MSERQARFDGSRTNIFEIKLQDKTILTRNIRFYVKYNAKTNSYSLGRNISPIFRDIRAPVHCMLYEINFTHSRHSEERCEGFLYLQSKIIVKVSESFAS